MSLSSLEEPALADQRRMEPGGVQRIAAQHGTAFLLAAGQTLRVTDPQGEQVADLIAYNANDRREYLSSGRTLDYANTIYLTTGHTLYSNRSRPMFEIISDTVGCHDFLLTPCSQETFAIIYDHHAPHRSCFSNLVEKLAPFGIEADAIPTTLNLFMNVAINSQGRLAVLPPKSTAGDYIELKALQALIVGLTACSAEMSNNYSFKPIHYEVR